MPGFLYHLNSVATCPHGATIKFAPQNTRVFIMGVQAAMVVDLFTVAGCPFQIPVGAGTKPQPCVQAILAPATKVFINGVPAVLSLGTTLCRSVEQIPQGPAAVSATQPKVSGI